MTVNTRGIVVVGFGAVVGMVAMATVLSMQAPLRHASELEASAEQLEQLTRLTAPPISAKRQWWTLGLHRAAPTTDQVAVTNAQASARLAHLATELELAIADLRAPETGPTVEDKRTRAAATVHGIAVLMRHDLDTVTPASADVTTAKQAVIAALARAEAQVP